MEPRKIFVWCALLAGACFFGVAAFLKQGADLKPVQIPTEGKPTIGNKEAHLHFVLFEDFRCHDCKLFNENVFPKLKALYIDKGEGCYTFIPVAFLKESMPLANAALAVFQIAPDKGFDYIHNLFELFQNKTPAKSELLDLAEKVGQIDIGQLEQAILGDLFYSELEENLRLARKLMGGSVTTPTLFINGFLAPTDSLAAITKRVDQVRNR